MVKLYRYKIITAIIILILYIQLNLIFYWIKTIIFDLIFVFKFDFLF